MSLFNQILGAINNPEQEANPNQLASILDTVQKLSGNYNTNPSAIQSAMSIVGSFTRSALQNQRSNGGEGQVQQLINQFAGTQANYQVLQALFNNSQLQNMTQQISNRTGLNPQAIQSLLPILVPLVLNFLKTGNNTTRSQANNSVLDSFLDGDRDGDVDIADAISMASRFLGR
ncbi:hypothetical protein Sta7437_0297 [Stanieria cyanosphaera PCC 7437]|uniref:DUF937 domain-containing protein n=1 Tax=Stanieria cyanosphaera (strain ATCC 29371 / PCC 7437) TaxID=111780 RepID=K9XMT3_STAC7|nr:DUF937 domain-containing protein [Stanieria cyanosphaera]AFZ33910.1 hypothetical protein Sta7437_0297 [Stanieria cyanosphaera PCC 7437]